MEPSILEIVTTYFIDVVEVGTVVFCRDEATQLVSLQLVEIMVQTMGGADVAYILPHVTLFATHPSMQCRQLMYTILIAIYSSS